MSNNEYEFTDRYKALGIPYPDLETMCKGQCEGTGVYPQFLAGPWLKAGASTLVVDSDVTGEETQRWHDVHTRSPHEECDGWHFIKCTDCEGNGKRQRT